MMDRPKHPTLSKPYGNVVTDEQAIKRLQESLPDDNAFLRSLASLAYLEDKVAYRVPFLTLIWFREVKEYSFSVLTASSQPLRVALESSHRLHRYLTPQRLWKHRSTLNMTFLAMPLQFGGPLSDLYLHFCSVGLTSTSSGVRAACVGILGPVLSQSQESMEEFLPVLLRMGQQVI